MPIHLGQQTRRRFLAGAAGAAAAVVLPDWASGVTKTGTRTVDPHRFALLSDTHVPADPMTEVRGVNMSDHFGRALRQVAALEPTPAGVMFCGDLAYESGQVEDYNQFAPTLLQTLLAAGVPTHLLLGNHDHRENFFRVLMGQKPGKPIVADRHVSIVESPRANWFLLDSLDIVDATPGLLGEEQLAWLDEALALRSDRPAIVMAHHDLHLPRPGEPDWWIVGLQDTNALLKILLSHRHVKAYLFGHRHRWWAGRFRGLHLVNLPAVAYVFERAQTSAWILAHLKKNGMTLEVQALNTAHPVHGGTIRLHW